MPSQSERRSRFYLRQERGILSLRHSYGQRILQKRLFLLLRRTLRRFYERKILVRFQTFVRTDSHAQQIRAVYVSAARQHRLYYGFQIADDHDN